MIAVSSVVFAPLVLGLLLAQAPGVSPEAFSSTAHLKQLSNAEGEVVGMLSKYVSQEEIRLNQIRG